METASEILAAKHVLLAAAIIWPLRVRFLGYSPAACACQTSCFFLVAGITRA